MSHGCAWHADSKDFISVIVLSQHVNEYGSYTNFNVPEIAAKKVDK